MRSGGLEENLLGPIFTRSIVCLTGNVRSLIPVFNQVEFTETIYGVNRIILAYNFLEGGDRISITLIWWKEKGDFT